MVINEFGIHARPAAVISKIAGTARHPVWIHYNTMKVDATSVIDVLTLCCARNSEVDIEIEAKEDINVLNSIVDFFNSGFGETHHE